MKRLLLCICCVCCCITAAPHLPAPPQRAPLSHERGVGAPSAHATLVGFGRVRQLDTYLSPLEYSGAQLLFIKDKLRPTTLLRGRVSFQSALQIDFSSTHPASENADNLGADIDYAAAWHYHWQPAPRLDLMAGPQLAALVGGLYNTRNGNNPAQAYFDVHLAASLGIGYRFCVRRQPFILHDQLDVPLLGAMFSPAYGQSYYEIFSLDNRDHNILATHPFNAPALRNKFYVDVPFRRTTLRVGYLVDVRQSHLNHLRHHAYTHAFLIGWVRHFSLIPPK